MRFLRWLVLLSVAGCAEPTSSLDAYLAASASDTALQIDAVIFGINVESDISDGERFTARFRGKELVLGYAQGGWRGTFDLDSPPVADEEIVISFERDGDDDAPSSTATVAPAFVLDPVPLFISRSKDVTLAWSPASDDRMKWNVDSYCASGGGEIAPGATSLTLAEADWTSYDGATCTADLLIQRVRTGQIDPHFSDKSTIMFRWQQHVPFASTR